MGKEHLPPAATPPSKGELPVIPPLEPDEYVCELIQFNVVVGQWHKGKDGRRRKLRQVEFNPMVKFASEEPGDTNAWGDMIEREILRAEGLAREQVEAEARTRREAEEQERIRREITKDEKGAT